MNNSVKKCCICNNEKIGEFITINDNKYHLCCIEKLQQENNQLKEQRQELRSWLEAMVKIYENEYKDVDTAEHYNSVLSKLNELEGGKND